MMNNQCTQRMNRQRGFTILQVVGVVAGLILVLILIPAVFSPPRRPAYKMQNATQLRGIHQGMVIFGQSNKLYYPGLDSQGNVIDATVEGRLDVLLAGDYFTPEYIINPRETAPITEAVDDPLTGKYLPLTAANYSYAMLSISRPGDRRDAWKERANTLAVMLSDRDTAGNPASPASVWGKTPWEGAVLWDDNHVDGLSPHIVPTNYDPSPGRAVATPGPAANPADNLFDPAGPDDAYLIHSGK